MRLALALALLPLATAAGAASAPDSSDKRVLAQALRLYHKLDLAAALEKFDDAIGRVPGWKTAAGLRAAARWTLGDGAGAADDARVAAKLNPNDALSYASRGKARLVLRDYDRAIDDFKACAEADRRSVECPLGLGSALSAKGQARPALAPLDEAVRLDPGSAAALLVRGSVKDRLRDYAGSSADYQGVLEINPRFSWAYYYRGKALREQKDYRGAEADLSSFLESHPDHEDGNYMRSNLRYMLGDYRGAAADLTKVIAVNPRKGAAYANRGQARAQTGDREGALSDLRKAMELDPSRRDKIAAAIERLEAESGPMRDPGEDAAPRPRPAPRPAPGEDEDTMVTIEGQGESRAPRRRAPVADLDEEAAPAPKPEDAKPARKPRREPAVERHTGSEESLFID